ncbi:MAG: tyrosine-type recombinase/integrase [Gammaproteobacteria bacterium]
MLTDTAARNAKQKNKPYKLADEKGLYLRVNHVGKYWRFDYRFAGKRKTLALGIYPDVLLKVARDRRDDARRLLADGRDPSTERRVEKIRARSAAEDSFAALAREWMDRQQVAPTTASKNKWLLETFAIPYIGTRPIAEINAPELLAVLRRVEATGALETTQRLKVKCGQVFRYAIATGRAINDPTAALRGALQTPKATHHAAVTDPKAIGELMRAIDGFSGQFVTLCALKLAPLVFVRPGELRQAEWSEFDLDTAQWRIPGEKMKMKAPHIVPLSKQAVEILRNLHLLTGYGRYVFPSLRSPDRPMSENTVNAGLRRLGYAKNEMTGHGFRSMAATRLNEMGFRPDAIERQLAHAESDKVRDAYTAQAQYLAERKKMMQAWANYLDALKSGADVVPIRGKVA